MLVGAIEDTKKTLRGLIYVISLSNKIAVIWATAKHSNILLITEFNTGF
jgi:hypothetical protein